MLVLREERKLGKADVVYEDEGIKSLVCGTVVSFGKDCETVDVLNSMFPCGWVLEFSFLNQYSKSPLEPENLPNPVLLDCQGLVLELVTSSFGVCPIEVGVVGRDSNSLCNLKLNFDRVFTGMSWPYFHRDLIPPGVGLGFRKTESSRTTGGSV